MSVDKNVFFREAIMRICSSLDIATALRRCFDYVKKHIPMSLMTLKILETDLNVYQFFAWVCDGMIEKNIQVLPLPEEGRKERAAWLENEDVICLNDPDKEPGLTEIFEKLGLKSNVSAMTMTLKLDGNLVGGLGVVANGINQYNNEHVGLYRLLREPFTIAMSNALEHQEVGRLRDMLAKENRYLYQELQQTSAGEIIGSDFGLFEVIQKVKMVAPLDSSVLLLGETGTGKEVIANAIHYNSNRKNAPFIKVNCGGIPENLVDSELFGHERGAFTGAITKIRGRFERADKGTIFLDEIGELPPQAQVKLLRVLQEKKIERVGGRSPIPLDIRIISATNRNLQAMIASEKFREDLWFRLNVFPVMIPPLRQRKEDIPALVYHFIETKCLELKLPSRPVLAPHAMEKLVAHDWPGNVRELQNLVERALIQCRDGKLFFDNLLPSQAPGRIERSREAILAKPMLSLEEMTVQHIEKALHKAGGKINGPGGAAQLLEIHPNTLRTRMSKLGISYGRNNCLSH